MQFIQQSPMGGRRGGDVRPHEDGVQTDALDVGPRDGQGLVPAQQPEEPGPPQQKQTPDAGRVGVQLHIVHPAKAGPVLQLDDFLAAQLPKGHLPRPLTVPSYAGAGRTMQKGWKTLPRMCYTGRSAIPTFFKEVSSMYKNIVFDFGGVMVDFDPHKYLIDLFGNRGLEEEVYDLTFGSREWRLLDAGRITRREANERMLQRAKAVGRGFEVEGVLDDWMSMLRPRRRMQTLVAQLKQRGYCVYYLSNIPEDVLDLLMHRDFEGLFDGGVASCEVKINKPDPRIYQALLDKYHLRADECIFIDDRADNLVAASALGFGIYEMHGVGTLLRSLPTFGVSLH